MTSPTTRLRALLDRVAETPGCTVHRPEGLPSVEAEEVVPADLRAFYEACGGMDLFVDATYPMRIVPPRELVLANPVIVGERCADDISCHWYVVARGGREEMITIDCSPPRLGRCHDSFWDRHGVAGSCAIVALSFTELLERLLEQQGGYWYWLADGAPAHGDAYG
ncbi:MAG: SMI1/KNR4 family protein [Myxococcales bacterium]|nr:SMI1/KNR4 family protein [Myxococcales bacterium]